MITSIFIGLFVFFFSDLPSKHPFVKSTWKQIASLNVRFFSPSCTANHSLMTLKMWTTGDYSFELLFTEGRMRNKPKKHLRKGLQEYIGNVSWPSEVSQQTTTRQGKAYIYKTILCQRRREMFSINVNQINRHGQPITTKNRFWIIAFSCWKRVKRGNAN